METDIQISHILALIITFQRKVKQARRRVMRRQRRKSRKKRKRREKRKKIKGERKKSIKIIFPLFLFHKWLVQTFFKMFQSNYTYPKSSFLHEYKSNIGHLRRSVLVFLFLKSIQNFIPHYLIQSCTYKSCPQHNLPLALAKASFSRNPHTPGTSSSHSLKD